MKDHTTLDTAILRAIDAGANTFSYIVNNDAVWSVLRELPNSPTRRVGRRLQALRRRGVVQFDRGARAWRRA